MTEIQIFKRKIHKYTQIEKFLFCIKNTQLKKKKKNSTKNAKK